jgi:hypothetical protein
MRSALGFIQYGPCRAAFGAAKRRPRNSLGWSAAEPLVYRFDGSRAESVLQSLAALASHTLAFTRTNPIKGSRTNTVTLTCDFWEKILGEIFSLCNDWS